MRSRRRIAACAASVVIVVTVGAYLVVRSRFEAGILALKTGDYESAAEKLRSLAYLGHEGAQYHLGEMYAFGWGVGKDDDEAISWFRRAARWTEGTTDPAAAAEYFVAVNYESGTGVERNPEEARRWYERSAAGGYKDAHEKLLTLAPGATASSPSPP